MSRVEKTPVLMYMYMICPYVLISLCIAYVPCIVFMMGKRAVHALSPATGRLKVFPLQPVISGPHIAKYRNNAIRILPYATTLYVYFHIVYLYRLRG